MSKQIKFNLSQKSIQNAIKQLEQYKVDLNRKCQVLVKLLAEHGYSVADAILLQHIYTGQTEGSIRIEDISSGGVTKMSIVVESDAILFLEFGSGIKYSGTVNPKASELGMGPGTYPGEGHWDDPNGWWYLGDDGEYHHSFGIEASMPMYKASREIVNNVGKIAKAVFK